MSPSEKTLWIAVTLFALVYALWPHLGLPTPLFAPVSREILWHGGEGIITMGWYGRILGSAVVTVGLTLLLLPARGLVRGQSDRILPGLAAVALAASMAVIFLTEGLHWFAGR